MNNTNTDPKYTLSIVSKLSGVPKHSIRQYVDKNLILPFITDSGRNLFSDVDVIRLRLIKKLFSEKGLNIYGIKSLFSLIPCWAIKKCSTNERVNCGGYTSTDKICWEADNKSEICKNTYCRECPVYMIPAENESFKSMIKEYVK